MAYPAGMGYHVSMTSLRLHAAALLLSLLPASAAACSCMVPKAYAERRLEYPVVFHGMVSGSGMDDAGHNRWIRFQVVKDYGVKASGADSLTVWTGIHGGVCGVDYPIGTGVLVFADTGYHRPSQEARLETSICTGNASGTGMEQALQEMERTLGVLRAGSIRGRSRGRSQMDGGQVIFAGEAQANGVLRDRSQASFRGRKD